MARPKCSTPAEVLYADEEDLRILDGATGAVRFIVSEHGSGTGIEYPVIADVADASRMPLNWALGA